MYLSIEVSNARGGVQTTPYRAIVRRFFDTAIPEDIWLPREIFPFLQLPVKFSQERSSFSVRITNPAKVLGVPLLASLAPNALDLDFQARNEDCGQFLSVREIEAVTGLSCKISAQNSVIVEPSRIRPKEEVPRDRSSRPTKRINLLWDHVEDDNVDLTAEPKRPGVRVISPTWFSLTDEAGGISSRGSLSYVRAAHARGYDVWALVSNGFNRNRTTKFLANRSARNLFIARMLAYASIYGFDGINIDFENVAVKDARKLTEFVRSLSFAGKSLGLTMSIDVMVPSKWSACYERKALASIVDYVALMAYDEHWRTSPKAGSTASLPWVESALLKTLHEVPAKKLLLGIPLYTREWVEGGNQGGKITVKSKTMSMISADLRMAEKGASKRWLPKTGQHYYEYMEGGKRYRVWMEDGRSISLRMRLVNRHNLAGAAFWRKGFEKPHIWELVERFGTE